MDVNTRIEFIDSLLRETTRNVEELEDILNTQQRVGMTAILDAPGTAYPEERTPWRKPAHGGSRRARN